MAATPSTTVYTTGKGATATIGATSYTQFKVAELPAETAAVVSITHVGGFQKLADGLTDYGRFRLVLPQDGVASRVNTTITTMSVAIILPDASTKTVSCASVYCTKDNGGNAERGNSCDREFIAECLAAPTWA